MATRAPLELSETDRGFHYATFTDRDGKPCEIIKSSLATQDCIRLGVEGNGKRMHLTQDMVRDLLPMLQRFVDTGELDG